MGADERLVRAKLLYEQAVFAGDDDALVTAALELDSVEADLMLARGRILHVRFLDDLDRSEDPSELTLFERARQLYHQLGNTRGEADALFWIGCFHQVVRGDNETAVPLFEQSYALATHTDDLYVQSEVLRHLGIADHAAGRLDAARANLEESSRLRRKIGLLPGVAANQVGLIYIAAAQGRRDDALAIVEEALAITKSCGAERIARQVEEARQQL
jgi:tetratricopeptide (TPR) repeat protein